MDLELINQHGDVLIYRIEGLPDRLKPVKPKGRHVLAEGEATGHAHVICDLSGADVFVADDGTLYLQAHRAVEVEHEEHATQTIEPGTYQIGRVREVDPFTEEVRRVAD